MKKNVLIFSFIALIACNDSKQTTIEEEIINVQITGEVSSERLEKTLSCADRDYSFSIPNFNSGTAADQILNRDIKGLITRDFTDVTYEKNASLPQIHDSFIQRRERILCQENKQQGFLHIATRFVTDNDQFTSYEMDYERGNGKGRLLKTFLKPELKDIHLSDLIPASKAGDVKTIFNANLQQAVANLVTDIEDVATQQKFIDHVRNTAFLFESKDFETAELAFQFQGDTSKNLRLAKTVDLPEEFGFLNNTVVIEIDVYQLSHYLDLSRVVD